MEKNKKLQLKDLLELEVKETEKFSDLTGGKLDLYQQYKLDQQVQLPASDKSVHQDH